MASDPRWRKVTKKHPGKKWELKRVIVAHRDCDSENGVCVRSVYMPRKALWDGGWGHMTQCGFEPITHWMPLPESPEMPKKGD